MSDTEPQLDREILSEYVDDQLDEATRLEVAQYLARNPSDAAKVEVYRNQNEALQRMVENVSSEPVQERFRNLIEQAAPAPKMPLQRRHWRRVALPLAAAAVLILSGYVGWFARGAFLQRRAIALANETFIHQAVGAYSLYAQSQMSPSGNIQNNDLSKFAAWFKQNLGAGVVLPTLDSKQYKVIAARILPSTGGAAGQIVFKSQSGKTLAWYFQVSSSPASAGSPASTASPSPGIHPQYRAVDKLSVYYWQSANVNYALVSTEKKETPDNFLKSAASQAPTQAKGS